MYESLLADVEQRQCILLSFEVGGEGDVVSFNQQAYRSLDTNYHSS
jgi:hypothetical protein